MVDNIEAVLCNYCHKEVMNEYLTIHFNNHIDKIVSSQKSDPRDSVIPMTWEVSKGSEEEVSKSTELATITHREIIQPKIRVSDGFKFRPLNNAYVFSSVSNSGRYSDMVITLTVKDKESYHSNSHVGSSSYTTQSDSERITINLVYDSVEDYYILNLKLIKRSHYSTWDSETCIPDRILYQNEILSEVRKALLFMGVSPKMSYKLFLKCLKNNSLMNSYSGEKVKEIHSMNYGGLEKFLKNKSSSSTYSGYSGYRGDYYGGMD